MNINDIIGSEDKLWKITIYLVMSGPENLTKDYQDNFDSFVNVVYKRGNTSCPTHYITTDLSTMLKLGRTDDLKYKTTITPYHEPRIKIDIPIDLRNSEFIMRDGYEYVAFLSDWKDFIRDEDPFIGDQLKQKLESGM